MAVIAWHNPLNLNGYVFIKGGVIDNDPYTAGICNNHNIHQDGIKWYIDRNSTSLAYGEIENASNYTGSQEFSQGENGTWLNKVLVNVGDVIYLSIHPNNNLFCDSTGVGFSIKVTDAPLGIPPSLSYSQPVDPEITDSDSVDFTVTFDEPVTGVDATDFHLDTTGSIAGASVSGVSGSGTTYTVTVNTGSGDGNIRLDAISTSGIFTSGKIYIIDKTAPDTQIDSSPASSTSSALATFTFSSMDVTATFECSLDAVAYASCESPKDYTSLALGSHTFNVRAVDSVGNVDSTPASFTWTRGMGFLYVTPGGTGDCSSWTNACTLKTALTTAVSSDEIWVAAGTHKPGTLRTDTFQLKNGVAVYGGFAGTETARDQRNSVTNVTILSGDIGAAGNSDNTYHVVTGTTGATLDGFTITAGNANGVSPSNLGGGMYNYYGSPTLTNVTFSGNSAASGGGGMYNHYLSNPTLTNVTFSGNSATSGGGGMYNDYLSDPTLTNVTFSGNSTQYGGGMYNYYSSPTLTNVTFGGNSAASGGGMCNNYYSNPQIRNTIFWGNTAQQISNYTSTPVVSNSVVQGGYAGGTNIITTDPKLGTLGNYGGTTQTIPLLPGSSAINTGNDATCAAADQRGVTRPQGAHCDIGAFELKPPNAMTNAVSTIASSGATLNGTVNANDTSAIVTFEYGLTASYGTTVTADESPVTSSTDTPVSKAITGLTPYTTYHYRVVAVNSDATTNGSDQTFTTSASTPAATTNAASALTSSGAMLNGTVSADDASATVTFEYGLDTGYGTTATATQSPVTGGTNTAVSKAITGLTPNTTYHYRVVAVNSVGITNGSDQTFTTSVIAPIAITNTASAITSSGATLNGTVNANNASAIVTFEYGLTTSYGATVTADESPVTGLTDMPASKAITGLTPYTTYHYRVVAVNSAGTTNGSDQMFTTSAIAPVAATDEASAITSSSATLNGTVKANDASATVAFEYGLDTGYGTTATAIQSPITGATSTAVSIAITGLTPNITYHYRVVAVNSVGTTNGSDMTFTTYQTLTLDSNGAYDGWILESSENSNAGGTMDSTSAILAVGDNVDNKQYRSIMDFSTSYLPNNAIIASATIKVRKYSLEGTDPFTTHGTLRADINTPYFGTLDTSRGLELGDFQATPDKSSAGIFSSTPVDYWYSATLSSASYPYISLTSSTQFRLRFSTDDNNDGNADYVRFASGNHATTANRPQLIVEYYVP